MLYRKMSKLCWRLIAVWFLLSSTASAEIIAECGPYQGFSYYFAGSLGDPGFSKDGTDEGSVSIVLIDDKFDIIYTDAGRKNRSSRATGAKVELIGYNEKQGLLVLSNTWKNQMTEILTYNSKANSLVYTSQRFNSVMNKASLFLSECSP